MPLLILSILIQVGLVIHIMKTGKNTTWIWIVIILPMAGSIAYIILEVLPKLPNSLAGRKVNAMMNPNKRLHQAAQIISVSDTIENSMRLADECMNKGLYEDAKTLYKKCLTGIHHDDPSLMARLARAEFMLGHYSETKATLDTLIKNNPDYKNQDAHLLYSRTLEALGDISGAAHEYEALHGYFSGPEASFYYAKFLNSQNQQEAAHRIFTEIINISKSSGKHYTSLHKEILKSARAEIAKHQR